MTRAISVLFSERIRSTPSVIIKSAVAVLLLIWYVVDTASFSSLMQQTVLFSIIIWYYAITVSFAVMRILVLQSYLKRRNLSSDHIDNFTIGIRRLSSAFSHIVFFVALLHILGLSLGQFFTSISIFMAALILLTREHILNFFNGAIILFTNRYNINDYLKVGDIKGRITDVTFQSIELLSDSGEVIYLPNSLLMSKEVFNLSKKKVKSFRVESVCLLLSQKQFSVLQKDISRALEEFTSHIVSWDVGITKIEKETCTIEVSVRIKNYRFEREEAIRQAISKAVLSFRVKK